jgi:3-vinyl bacteriochlorophyllide hydratase
MNVQPMRRGTSGAAFDGHRADASGDFSRGESFVGLDIGSLAIVQRLFDAIAPCPWPVSAGSRLDPRSFRRRVARPTLYSREERIRRDRSPWTLVQGILAPVQFLVFAVSLVLVARYLTTGRGYEITTVSIIAKTVALYAIMITGSIWEKDVFGRWLFARPFFWEDVFSMLVLGLQTAYLSALMTGWGSPRQQIMIAVAAYAAYIVNATQFLLKLRAARLEGREPSAVPAGAVGRHQ